MNNWKNSTEDYQITFLDNRLRFCLPDEVEPK